MFYAATGKMISGIMGNRGFALVIVLLIISTLIGLTVGFSEETSIEISLSGYSRDGYRAYQAARSVVHLALAVLQKDEDREMDSLREDWSRKEMLVFPEPFPDNITFTGELVDESGKLNINLLLDQEGEIDESRKEQLTRLFKVKGIEEEKIQPLLDWLDSNDIERLGGAENFYYQSREEPYACGNGPLITFGQLSLVKGFEDPANLGESGELNFRDLLTVDSDGKINVNTAPPEVLQSLSDMMDRGIADAIVEYRREKDFLSIDDLKKVPAIDEEIFSGISKWVTVRSSVFSIEATANYREAAARIKAVIERKEDKSPRLIYWQVM